VGEGVDICKNDSSQFKVPAGLMSVASYKKLANKLNDERGRLVLSIAPSVLASYARTGTMCCLLCPPGDKARLLGGRPYTMSRHLERAHTNIEPPPKSSPIIQALEHQRVLAERSKLTLKEAQSEYGALAATGLLRRGVSGNTINEIRLMPEAMLRALRLAPAKSTLLGEGGHADDIVDKFVGTIREQLRGVSVVLAIDGSSTRYAGGGKITLVTAESAELDHPLLLLVDVEQEGACDAEYYRGCLEKVMELYELTPDQIIGVATDNAAVMPKSVKLAKMLPLPCAAHLLNLMLKAFAEAMDFSNLFGWRLFVDDSSRRKEMSAAGLKPGSFNSAMTLLTLSNFPSTHTTRQSPPIAFPMRCRPLRSCPRTGTITPSTFLRTRCPRPLSIAPTSSRSRRTWPAR
jgi:hypothetical protein